MTKIRRIEEFRKAYYTLQLLDDKDSDNTMEIVTNYFLKLVATEYVKYDSRRNDV